MAGTGAYDRFKGAQPIGVKSWIIEGTHILEVRRTEMSKSKNPLKKNVEKAIVEFKVIESDTVAPGKIMSLVEMETNQGYDGNVMAVTAGILGNDIEELQADPGFESVFDSFWGEEQVCTGFLVRCIAQQVKTQAGGDYTAKTWEAIPADEYEKYGKIAPNGAYTPA